MDKLMRKGKLDIIANMLTATEKDALKGHIIDTCHLSSKQFNEYMEILLENGLIDAFPAVNLRHISGAKNRRRKIFHITQTGKQFLKLYSELYALVDRDATISFREFSLLFSAKRVLEHSSIDKEGEQE